ncbi:small-conductance mechanosensitive channel [Rhodoligotrophos appendicifer]|uniref:mechanosensitive ion channel domain-containing protein n=1 Tax=Rhodoligotrophos appendicifer TaxID=987056 RepID=UPI0014792A18|nr:mechanosensitive ion channel domain-containing protein [Rhodoligotrophos appendicifer]
MAITMVLAAPVLAQDAVLERVQRQVQPLTQEIEQLKQQLARPDISTGDLNSTRARIETIRTDTLRMSEQLQPLLNAANQSLDQLGPLPEGEVQEAPSVAEQRKQLTARRDAIRSVQAQLDLLRVSSQQLSEQASEIQHSRFFQKVFITDRSVMDPRLWLEGLNTVDPFVTRFLTVFNNWWSRLVGSLTGFSLILLLGELAAAIAAAVVTRRALKWLLQPRRNKPNPTDLERLWNVPARVIVVSASILVGILLIYFALSTTIETSQQATRIYWTLALSFAFMAGGRAFVRAMLSPRNGTWRVVELSDGMAHRLCQLLELLIILHMTDAALRRLTEILFIPVQFSIAQSAVNSILTAVLLVFILLTARRPEDPAEDHAPSSVQGRFGWFANLSLLYWALVGIICGALLLGFIALAQYVSQQIVVLTGLVVILMLIRYLADQLVSHGLKPHSLVGRFLRSALSLSNRGVDRFGVIITTLVDFGLVFVGLPLVILQTAVTWVDITSWMNTAFFGFRLGGLTISLYTVVAAAAAFVIGFLLTKLFTRWLDARVLSRTQLNKGVRDSIRTGVGYLGLILAALFALTYAGLNFDNLAIVAGALGVGIGFGLQSIVNNFVSGLILLAERPIKVGDLIKVSGGQGIVKRINVRSTEIETGEKSSIIVPNSSLITESVQNWTHSDTMGRIAIAVRADPAVDPETVIKLLVSAAQKHDKVLPFPAPMALFQNFGATANEYELYGYVADVLTVGGVASDVRIAIARLFEENKIGMPFGPQELKMVGDGKPPV